MNFKSDRDLPRIVLALFFLGVLLSDSFGFDLSKNTEILLMCITAIYVYFTYELLRVTKNNRNFPYVTAEFVLTSDFKSDFFKRYREDVNPSKGFVKLEQDNDEADQDGKNILFLKLENTGESLAIDVEVKIEFDRKNYTQEDENLTKTFAFKDLKPGHSSLELVELFEHPSNNDYFKIKKVTLTHSDTVRFNGGEKQTIRDITKNVSQSREEKTQVLLDVIKK